MIHNRFRLYLLVLIFCLPLVLIAGCYGKTETVTSTPISAGVVFPDFSLLVEKVSASVVAISTESVSFDSSDNPQHASGSGSGWILDEDGTIVTNNHVIEGADSITVELYDHKAYKAKIIEADVLTDTAVLKINAGRKLQPLVIADTSNIKVGDWVMILGNPLGLGISAKQGIISRLGVTMSSSPEQTYYNLIETSAAVNPGNSGGPMVNLNGEVIGMTSLKIDASGIEGLGYAMNIVDVIPVIRVLMTGEKVIRSWLGASLVTVDNGLFVQYDLPVETGALVLAIAAGGPADEAGIKVGDVIVDMDGKEITRAEDMNKTIESCAVGQEVRLGLWQEKNKKNVEVVLAACPIASSPASK